MSSPLEPRMTTYTWGENAAGMDGADWGGAAPLALVEVLRRAPHDAERRVPGRAVVGEGAR